MARWVRVIVECHVEAVVLAQVLKQRPTANDAQRCQRDDVGVVGNDQHVSNNMTKIYAEGISYRKNAV